MRLGRFLKPDMVIKNTPKAGSRKRKGSPHTVNKKVAISVPVSVVTNWLSDH